MIMTMILVPYAAHPIAGLNGYSFETSYRDKALGASQELIEKHQQNINAFLNEKLPISRHGRSTATRS